MAKKSTKPVRKRPKKIIELKAVTLAPERPNQTQYQDRYAHEARKLCQLGATDRDLAEFFDVTTVTIWRWQARYPEFFAALNRNKDAADDRVERSLYQRATGYTYDSEKIFTTKDGDVIREPILEHVPPDVTACIFWLKNRRASEWRDKTDHDHNHLHALNLQGGKMTVEDAQNLFREARNMTAVELQKSFKVIEGKVVAKTTTTTTTE
jgi:hypothetical protein